MIYFTTYHIIYYKNSVELLFLRTDWSKNGSEDSMWTQTMNKTKKKGLKDIIQIRNVSNDVKTEMTTTAA